MEFFLPEIPVDFFGIPDRVAIHHREDIILHMVSLKFVAGVKHTVEYAYFCPCEPVNVIQFFGAVKADTHKKPVTGEKVCPFVINAIALV